MQQGWRNFRNFFRVAAEGMPRYVYVYSGNGASHRSVLSTIESLKATLKGIQVRQMCGLDLLEGGWQEDTALLVFPGGADLPYCEFLNGEGNSMIADFVQSGGAYLGLCAGGYYACNRVEFEKDRPLEVTGLRELSFFPGLARGAVHPGFEYNTEAGSIAIPIQFKENQDATEWCECRDYSNGGPYFVLDSPHSQAVELIAQYVRGPTGESSPEERASAVRCQVGNGVAVLCGTHPELSPWWLDADCNMKVMRRLHPDLNEESLKRLVQNSVEIKSALNQDQAQRENLWKSLLKAAGLGSNIKASAPSDCIHPIAKGFISARSRERLSLSLQAQME